MDNLIEINVNDSILDFERQMLAEVNIPSLLPVNIIDQGGNESICFIATGYKAVSEMNITDIEGLCNIVKSFVKAIITSEQYLLVGGKHFLEMDMVFYDPSTKTMKMVFGRIRDDKNYFGDTDVILEFIDNLKSILVDNVLLKILDQIKIIMVMKNPDIKRIPALIDEVERKWYCRNLIPEIGFSRDRGKIEKTSH